MLNDVWRGGGGMMEGWWGDDGRGRGRGGEGLGGGFGVRVRVEG